jgi:hypothetical protein
VLPSFMERPMSDSWRFRINIAIIVGAIAVALHMLGIGSP